jgi:hypothetical protein
MTTLLCCILGTTYVCDAIEQLEFSRRARRFLKIITILGAALGAVGYYGEAVSENFGNRVRPIIEHVELKPHVEQPELPQGETMSPPG